MQTSGQAQAGRPAGRAGRRLGRQLSPGRWLGAWAHLVLADVVSQVAQPLDSVVHWGHLQGAETKGRKNDQMGRAAPARLTVSFTGANLKVESKG